MKFKKQDIITDGILEAQVIDIQDDRYYLKDVVDEDVYHLSISYIDNCFRRTNEN